MVTAFEKVLFGIAGLLGLIGLWLYGVYWRTPVLPSKLAGVEFSCAVGAEREVSFRAGPATAHEVAVVPTSRENPLGLEPAEAFKIEVLRQGQPVPLEVDGGRRLFSARPGEPLVARVRVLPGAPCATEPRLELAAFVEYMTWKVSRARKLSRLFEAAVPLVLGGLIAVGPCFSVLFRWIRQEKNKRTAKR